MTQLQELIYSLITVVIRYHDSQSGVRKIIIESNSKLLKTKSRELAMQSLTKDIKDIHLFLHEAINECTNDYSGRKSFLSFLFHEIQFLCKIYTSYASFTKEELLHNTKQITQMIFDFKTLLNTNKGINCIVNLSEVRSQALQKNKEIALSGLKNDGYLGNLFCNSGFLLKDEIMDRFNISLELDDDYHHIFAKNLCVEYQNSLLVPELEKENFELRIQLEKQSQLYSTLENQLTENHNEILNLKNDNLQLQKSLDDISINRLNIKAFLHDYKKSNPNQGKSPDFFTHKPSSNFNFEAILQSDPKKEKSHGNTTHFKL